MGSFCHPKSPKGRGSGKRRACFSGWPRTDAAPWGCQGQLRSLPRVLPAHRAASVSMTVGGAVLAAAARSTRQPGNEMRDRKEEGTHVSFGGHREVLHLDSRQPDPLAWPHPALREAGKCMFSWATSCQVYIFLVTKADPWRGGTVLASAPASCPLVQKQPEWPSPLGEPALLKEVLFPEG